MTTRLQTSPVLENLLSQAGLGEALAVEPLSGGRNNRVYRVEHGEGAVLFKEYYHSATDTRDRLGNEFGFLRHLQAIGSRVQPEPLGEDRQNHAGLMEYVQGSRVSFADVDEEAVRQAACFVISCNQANALESARSLTKASEACFSLSEHVRVTQERVALVSQLERDQVMGGELSEFVLDHLVPTWQAVRARIQHEAIKDVLPADSRILSPSDFGFHNSVRERSGLFRFIDFEYAGWDDPAKLLCDFSNQPDLLLPEPLSRTFSDCLLGCLPHAEAVARRARILEPLYQVKWACICLNVFRAVGPTSAKQGLDSEAEGRRRVSQLAKARMMQARALRILSP